MSPPVRQYSFSSGEIAPSLYARTDLNRYENGVRTARNMMVMRHGGLTGRPGTMYVGTTLNSGNAVRLIPFIFNETGLGQSYVLEFGNLYVAFYQNGGVVTSGGNPYTIVSPYAQADLATLDFAESGDIVTIVHPNYPPYELKRLGAVNWTLTQISFYSFPGPTVGNGPDQLIVTGGGMGGVYNYQYLVTAIDSNGNETDQGYALYENASGAGASPYHNFGTALSPTNQLKIIWDAVTGAVRYRVYREDFLVVDSGVYGFVGETTSTIFTDPGITPDFTQQPPIANSPFGGAGNYPSSVGYVQQRRVFAATKNNPLGFWMTRPGLPYNLNIHVTSIDSDAVIASIAGNEVNAIQHVAELKFMLLLTAGAEIYVQGNGNGVITPSAINASIQSQYGCAPLRPLKIGDVLVFNQALGSFVRDFAFDFSIDGYRGNDISVFASHLFEGTTLVDWVYQKTPDSIIWAARSDGVLLSCTYVREQQILAWTHHDMTNGFVENVCAIPENGQYAVYLSIRRFINGANPTSNITIQSGVNDAIDLFVDNAQGLFTARIAPGTYTGTSLATAVATALNNLAIFQISNWVVTYTAGHIQISQSGVAQTNYKLLWGTGAHSNISAPLGWPKTDTVEVSFSPFLNVAPGFLTSENQRFIERLSSRIWTDPNNVYPLGDPINATYLDCFSSFNGTNTSAMTMTLTVSGAFLTTPSAYQQQLTLTASAPYFGTGQTAQIGDQIFLMDAAWFAANAPLYVGPMGNQLKLTIQSISSNTVAVVTPEGIVPSEFQAVAVTTWARAVKTISGLSYLTGQKVSIWADRYVVGSPLNYLIPTVYTVPASGILTLDKCYSVIYVGLPMIQDVETLDLETYFGESLLGKRKRVSSIAAYLYNTRSFFAGGENPDFNLNNTNSQPLFQLEEMKRGEYTLAYDQPPELFTDQDYVINTARWNKNGRVFLRNVDPLPFSVLAISPRSDEGPQVPPYSKRV